MKVFITGGTGFIGRFVVNRLLRGRDRLLLLVRKPSEEKKVFPAQRRLRFLRGNLSEIGKLEPKLKKFKPDVCVHLAWEGIPDYGVETSLKNLEYGLNLLRLLVRVGCKKVVISGSCWEYGAERGKISEDRKSEPKNPFAAAKESLRILGEQIAKANNMDFVWLRLFYVYGPGQKKLSLIPYLVERARNGLPPDLKNARGGNDFVYVDDVARAIVAAARKKNASGIYNVGSGKIVGMAEITNLIYGKNMVKATRPQGFRADISRIRHELRWSPSIGIKKGIKLTSRFLQ